MMMVQCRAKSEPTKMIMAGERVDWSDLPTELCSIIGERLDRRIDVLRFRSVCRSWRSAIPPFYAPASPRLSLKFPQPNPVSTEPRIPRFPVHLRIYLRGPDYRFARRPAYLSRRTFYTLQRLNPTASTSSADHKSWLIEVEESNSGKFRLIDPSKWRPSNSGKFRLLDPFKLLPLYSVSNLPIMRYPVNLLDTRLVELTTAYRARHNFSIGTRPEDERINIVRCGIHGVKKVVIVPNSAKNNNADDQVRSFFVVFDDGNLGFANCGDEDLTLVGGGRNVECHDIVVYKGKLYFVDMWGAVWWIKYPSLELLQISRPLYGFGSPMIMKRLVESCGALYLLDGYFNMMNSSVYKLNEGCGRWVRVKSLGDQVFVLFSDCSFSISALEVAGFRSNCIYFIQDDGIRIYSFEVHS